MAASERRLRILAQLTDGSGEHEVARLCEGSAAVTGLNGAGIMLMSGEVNLGSVGASDDVSALIEESQFALGEGPCVDAFREDRSVLEPDLAAPTSVRWPAFAGSVLGAGARAVFGFPLHLGQVRLGALDLYRDRPGSLTDDQHRDALTVADIVTRAVLVIQADAPKGRLAAELEEGADLHLVVHQAAGRVAAQLDVGVGEALVRLRAYAFGADRSLMLVAGDVVAGRLRFDRPADGSEAGR